MPLFSSSNSWTNQAKNSPGRDGSAHRRCSPARSSFLSSSKAWSTQANNAYRARQAELKAGVSNSERTLTEYVAELKRIQGAKHGAVTPQAERAAKRAEQEAAKKVKKARRAVADAKRARRRG